ncbi:MAG: hypothetical protein B7Z12_06750 [Caulobacter vibrioides]|uniref:Uncharacterized protein n=1 Tax=Caulobacter vibrioides TaxID=155892 RepID=A0A258D9C2_CAUVI|nr:MAG: hypothetical protein B7Z12_06750 [Caulobacter vibrioides]
MVGRAALDPNGVRVLLHEGSLRATAHRDALVFAHDIYEDWALARALDRDRSALPRLLQAVDQPLWWLRPVRLVGQIAFETSGPSDWLDLVRSCAQAEDLDPVWWRTLLVAPLYSERATDLLAAAESTLLADDAEWLERLIDTLQILESRPNEMVFENVTGSLEERQRVAAAFPKPSGRSWLAFLTWAGKRWAGWPGRLVPKLAQLANTWLRTTEGHQLRSAQMLVRICFDWLVEIEDARTFARWEERRAPFGYDDHDRDLWEKTATLLRQGIAYGVASEPSVVETYLVRVSERDRARECDDLLKLPRQIPSRLPRAWADFCIAYFAPRQPRVRHDFFMGHFNALDFHDAGLRSLTGDTASPSYAGFDQLFEADPAEALRMFRRFEKRASVFYRHYMRQNDGRRPRALRVQFPWGEVPLWGDENSYRWARGLLGSDVLGSAYMALDLWMGRQAAEGRSLEELFRLVVRPHGLSATLCPCINVAVEQISTPGQIDAVGPILAEPRVWTFEVRRFTDDLSFARQPLVPYYAAGRRQGILEVGARYAKRQHVRNDLALPFMLFAGEEAQTALNARVATWTAADLACFEDQLQDTGLMAEFDRQVERYRVDLDRTNIKFEQVDDQLQVSIVPPAPIAQQIATLDQQQAGFNAASRLMLWGIRGLEQNALQDTMDLDAAIELAQSFNASSLFSDYRLERFNEHLAAQGVAATAAVVARLAPDAALDRHREWVTETLLAAADVKRVDEMFDFDGAYMGSDPATSAARGLSALVARGGDRAALAPRLLMLATDRHDHIAAAVVTGLNFKDDPAFAWAVARATFADAQYWRGKRFWEPNPQAVAKDRQKRREKAFKAALVDIRQRRPRPIPPPPPPFQTFWALGKSLQKPVIHGSRRYPVLFDWNRVEVLLKALPLKSLASDLRLARLLGLYLQGVTRWAKLYSERGRERHDQQYPFKLMDVVGKLTGRLAFLVSDANPSAEPWRVFTALEERDHEFELVGDFLEGNPRPPRRPDL